MKFDLKTFFKKEDLNLVTMNISCLEFWLISAMGYQDLFLISIFCHIWLKIIALKITFWSQYKS